MGPLTGTSIFLFFFAFGYLIAGKNVILTLSTRIVLVVLFGCAASFAISGGTPWHDVLGAATMILNVIFLAFGIMDYLAFLNNRTRI